MLFRGSSNNLNGTPPNTRESVKAVRSRSSESSSEQLNFLSRHAVISLILRRGFLPRAGNIARKGDTPVILFVQSCDR